MNHMPHGHALNSTYIPTARMTIPGCIGARKYVKFLQPLTLTWTSIPEFTVMLRSRLSTAIQVCVHPVFLFPGQTRESLRIQGCHPHGWQVWHGRQVLGQSRTSTTCEQVLHSIVFPEQRRPQGCLGQVLLLAGQWDRQIRGRLGVAPEDHVQRCLQQGMKDFCNLSSILQSQASRGPHYQVWLMT